MKRATHDALALLVAVVDRGPVSRPRPAGVQRLSPRLALFILLATFGSVSSFGSGQLAHADPTMPGPAGDSLRCPGAPCQCHGDPKNPYRVGAQRIRDCIVSGRVVDVKHARLDGDLDLSAVPGTRIPPGRRPGLPGLPEPRSDLQLDTLERTLASAVPGVRLLTEAVLIRDSVIDGALRGPLPLAESRQPYVPLTFLRKVDLSGTKTTKGVVLRHTRFVQPLDAQRVRLEGGLDARGTHFLSLANFQNARFGPGGNFYEATFTGRADFKGVQADVLNFRFATFRQGAWFQRTDASRAIIGRGEFYGARFDGETAVFEHASLGEAQFGSTTFTKGARFQDAEVWGDATFERASFAGRTFFNGAIFAGRATFVETAFVGDALVSFDHARFVRPATFIGSRFEGRADFIATAFDAVEFLDVEFKGPADFTGLEVARIAEFGDSQSRTTFRQRATFDRARLPLLNLESVRFDGRASFVGTIFGPGCRGADGIAANLSGVSFGDVVNFQRARFSGRVNVPDMVVEAGKVLWRWSDIGPILAVERVRLDTAAICCGGKAFATLDPVPRSSVLTWIERNFRAQERVDDANAVLCLREGGDTWETMTSKDSPLGSRIVAGARYVFYGLTSCYGVAPLHTVATLILVALGFTALYVWSGRALRWHDDPDQRVQIKVTALPRRPPSLLPPDRGSRWWPALGVSVASLASVQVAGAHVELSHHDRFWWWLFIERMLGLALIVLLLLAVTNSVPVLSKFLGWLI